MLYTALLTLHLAGLALGLGGATIGDLAILRHVRKGGPHPAEQLRYLSQAIWLGLAVLGVSGVALFALQPSAYLHSSGFVAKMIVVAVLMGNGVYLHRQIPKLRIGPTTFLSGSISTVSWYSALAIAMFRGHVQLSVVGYLSVYLAAVAIAWVSYVQGYRWLRTSGRAHTVSSRPTRDARSGPTPPLTWYRLGRSAPATVDRTTRMSESPLGQAEREELIRLRHENWVLRMEKESRRRRRYPSRPRTTIS
jgi:hypothetical protein